jgi:2',3'-cyclic-nucleotide 2'-phosphodiesterase (5'-nucleotidase family)
MRIFKVSIFLILILGLGCKTAQQVVTTPNRVFEFTFLQINDVYEIAPLEGGKTGGMARVKALHDQLMIENPNLYTVLSGDFLNPSVIGTCKLDGQRVKGAQMVDMMNRVGVDFVTFGNHEFDLDLEDLQKRIDESGFKWISTNVKETGPNGFLPFARKSGAVEEAFPEYEVLNIPSVDGEATLRVGLIGLCLLFNKRDYVVYEDPFYATERILGCVRPETDFVMAITHLSMDMDKQLAGRFSELRLIMGGHEHENMFEVENGVPIAKADANAKTAYVHRIRYELPANTLSIDSKLVPLNESITPDKEIAAAVQDWETRAYQAFRDAGYQLDKVITKLKEPLNGLETDIRTKPTNLGSMIAEAMVLASPGAQCAFVNSGSVRIDDMISGEITEFDVIRTLPFGGGIENVTMKGRLLEKVLEAGLKNAGSGGYLQTFDLRKQGGKWQIGGDALVPEADYVVATSGFLMGGGESNLEFLTCDHADVVCGDRPDPANPNDIRHDIRKVLIQYLKNR